MSNVRLSASGASIVADVTAAYEPDTGVRKFIRKFEFTAPGRFVVTDLIETERPLTVTAFLHSDNAIKKESEQKFIFEPGGTSLSVTISAPQKFDTKIEKNILTAPGKPGFVDKGEREERGVRLAVSTKVKVSKLNLETTLHIERKQ